jgi:mitochondrial fission protein ELM1
VKRIELLLNLYEPPYKTKKPKQKCVMTQKKATHDPIMHITKLSPPSLPCCPSKEKNLGPLGVNVSFPQLPEQNFDLKFVSHHFSPPQSCQKH